MNFFDFFTDPVLRGPTWATLFMSLSFSLMGTIFFLKKRSLVAESLSHAAYPGAILGACLFAIFFPAKSEGLFFASLAGALISAFLGSRAIDYLEKKRGAHSDVALCFILALFFGIGTVAASAMQFFLPSWRIQLQSLMFGQAATMSDSHIFLYASLAGIVAFFVVGAMRPLSIYLFDEEYAKSTKLPIGWIERGVFWLFLFSLILGMRSVGIVLMSGMAILPAVAARQYTDRLQTLFCLSGVFGALSALFGNFFSVLWGLPTGPSMILTAGAIACLSLLFAPKKGFVFRFYRIATFRFRCVKENLLKALWKKQPMLGGYLTHKMVLWRLKKGGWVDASYALTSDGKRKAASIVRLHRLWELYLASELGISHEKIHMNAEEMEHILTPDIEERLTHLLENPTLDPHEQPIPERVKL